MIDKEKLKKAQEWADQASEIAQYSPTMPERAKAAAEVIKSLPDTIVDGEELREWRDKHKGNISNSGLDDMEDMLPAPPAPRTLADMSPEERAECQWMQADVSVQGETFRVVITQTVDKYLSAETVTPAGFQVTYDQSLVTPLPDLPRMEWPGNEPDDVATATGGELATQDVVDECRAVRKERAAPEAVAEVVRLRRALEELRDHARDVRGHESTAADITRILEGDNNE